MRTHSIQVMTEDGAYLLCFASEESARLAYTGLKATVREAEWLELTDDEDTSLFVRVDSLHSVAFAPVPEAPTLESIFNLKKEAKVN